MKQNSIHALDTDTQVDRENILFGFLAEQGGLINGDRSDQYMTDCVLLALLTVLPLDFAGFALIFLRFFKTRGGVVQVYVKLYDHPDITFAPMCVRACMLIKIS